MTPALSLHVAKFTLLRWKFHSRLGWCPQALTQSSIHCTDHRRDFKIKSFVPPDPTPPGRWIDITPESRLFFSKLPSAPPLNKTNVLIRKHTCNLPATE
ncbi:unnamed protein product [Colias eurytheme]|nr:unnamed protein product [Colias eurytheme]